MNKELSTAPEKIEIAVYPKDLQTTGSFDGGRITETKPIPFPHEGPEVNHTGPLFYWAWATAAGYGKIGLHPHRGFEIISYALEGEIGHYDTLGNRSRVHAGGAQIMQTASGVSHEEETIGDRTDFFQIWFEPDIRKTANQRPTYQAFEAVDFPIHDRDGVSVKTILGKGSPAVLETDVLMQDVSIPSGRAYDVSIAKGKSLALVAVSGEGLLFDNSMGSKVEIHQKDLVVVHGSNKGDITLQPANNEEFRFIGIEAPAKVSYPLYKKGR